MRGKEPKFKYVFLWLDCFVFTLSFAAALRESIPAFLSIFKEHPYYCLNHIFLFFLFLSVFLFSFRFNTMYRRNVLITHYRQFVLVVKSLLGGTLIITILMVIFNLQYFNHYGKELVLYFSLYSLVLLFFLRVVLGKIIFHFFIRKNLYPQRILVIGGEKAGKHVVESLKRDKDSMIIIAGILDDYLEKGKKIIEEHHNLGGIDDLKEVVNSHEVSEILIAIDNAPYSRLIYIVEECLKTGLPVRIYSDFLNVVAEKMRVEYYANIPLVVLSQYPLESNAWIDKRTMDIILASLALVMLSMAVVLRRNPLPA